MKSQTRYLVASLMLLILIILLFSLTGKKSYEQSVIINLSHEQTSLNSIEHDNTSSFKDEDDANRDEQQASTGSSMYALESGQRQHLLDILAFPNRVADFDFNSCDMSTCFDYSLCNVSDTLRLHILADASEQVTSTLNIKGESNIIHERILQIIRRSKYYEPDPGKACLFMFEDDTLDRDPLSASFRQSTFDLFKPQHKYGMNHIMFNLYSGSWPDYRENDFAGLRVGAAILVKASNSLQYHRDKFDISIPLFSYLHPTATARGENFSNNVIESSPGEDDRSSLNKTYLLTFKGKRYVIGTGSESRNSLYHLNNQRDVIMLTTCRHGKKWREMDDSRCSNDDNIYEQYDFEDLMRNSIFCLTPRGRRLGSFRFLEAMNHTCIPVVLGDGWVWPFGELIDWTPAAVQFPESELFLVPDTLRDYDVSKIKSMQANCSRLYSEYFSTIDKIVLTTIDTIERRIKRAIGR